MASFHSRSNSFPSQSHPAINDVEDQLERLKASQATSTSSICANLASLKDLHDGINNMIQMSSIQQSLSHEQEQVLINELLEGSLRLVDLCGISRDIVQLTKESVQDLESSIRRNKVEAVATSSDINAYVASRKKINKMVSKCIKNLKSSSNQNSTPLPAIGTMLKEVESLDFSILKSVLALLSGENNKKSWSLLSKFTQDSKRVHSQESCAEDLSSLNIQKSQKNIDGKNMLKTSEMTIQEVEEGLEALFKSLVKTRVSLLNVLSH
ncbi:hypothetical protein CASFOL_016882 [Castilleja foliolosa]|uniref:Uncharacterized protein n=1 Tax=Castilleja foliolosa TaxID=1961234 RepID=A0ABD3D9H5_9LAMI